MKKIILLFAALLWLVKLQAQPVYPVYGTVVDGGRPIPGAVVRLLNSQEQTITDAGGKFTMVSLHSGYYQLAVSAKGYPQQIAAIQIPLTKMITVNLFTAGRALNEIVVTAQKQEQGLQQVPLSVTALTADRLTRALVWDIKNLAAFSPNLNLGNPGDNRNVTGIRGVVTTSYNPAVATYVDGVNQFNLDTYLSPLLDIERVEILRGPQGTLYGRNAMGGVINIITRQPADTLRGFAEASLGSYGQQRYSMGFSSPLIKGRLFLSAAGLLSSLNGFYTNRYNGNKFDRQHYFLGNYTLRYQPSRQWKLSLNVKNMANRNSGAFPLAGSVEEALANPFTVNQNAVAQMVDNTLNTSLSVNHTDGYFNFSSQTAYQQNYRYYRQPIDGDFSPADAVAVVNNYGPQWNKVRTLTQEFRLASPAGQPLPLSWVAGAYGFLNTAPNKSGTYFGQDAALAGAPVADATAITINNSRNYGLALFAQATYTIITKLKLTAGLRYDAERTRQSVQGLFRPGGGDDVVTQPDTAAVAHFNALSPVVNLAWQAGGGHLLYGSYNRGFRSGGLSPLASDPEQPPLRTFAPEHSNNFELGLKNKFAALPLQWNIALFYTTVNDVQVPTLILPDAITVTRNAGHLIAKGIETELEAQPLTGLIVNYSFGYTHARYQSLAVSANGAVADLSGNRQLFTPEFTSLLSAQYTHTITRQIALLAGADWRCLGKQYFDLANRIVQNSYSLFNLRVGAGSGKYQLLLWGSNVLNRYYFDYAYDFGAVHYGNPRMWGATVRYTF